MDYHSIHGYDLSSFEIPSPHHVDRLPTVQASQALSNLQDSESLYISTGLDILDRALLSSSVKDAENASIHGGVKRGQNAENVIWIGELCTDDTAHHVVIADSMPCPIDCFQELQTFRLEDALRVPDPLIGKGVRENKRAAFNSHGKFIHFSCLTLPHLMALISRPNPRVIPERVALVIVSNLSALINSWLPKAVEKTTGIKPNRGTTEL
ncbi:hypothetical protein E4U55_000309 [Claviceps digitariae]|nr:hypothetical protein E4U55_000309 [Claviceps digitariae]